MANSSTPRKPGAAAEAVGRTARDVRRDADVTGGQADVRFRLRVRKGDLLAIGPGKVALLEAIAEHGSISAAARSLGMSYRRAWLLIDELNRALTEPATHSGPGGASGGGSTLTPVGERIIALYRGIEARAREACAEQIRELTSLMTP